MAPNAERRRSGRAAPRPGGCRSGGPPGPSRAAPAALLVAGLALCSPWLAAASESVRHADADIHLSGDDGNGDPAGIWSDGDTVWVADTLDNRLYAYRLATGERDAARDFDTLADYTPAGLWSDGATLWVLDYYDGDAAAYDLATGQRRAAQDVRNIGRELAGGLWSDGRTLWIAHTGDDELRAHRRRDGARDGARDFDTLAAAGNGYVTGLWSDGVTMWVADHADAKLYAYRMDTRERDPARDVALDAQNRNPIGLWSDGETLWVSDYVEDRLFAYRPPRRDGARLSALALSGIDLPFVSGTLVYALEVPHEVAATTVGAVAQAGATAAIAPADADAALGGHQVDLSFGADIDIAVAAADGASGTYTVTVRRLPPPGGSLAALHLDGIDLGTLVPFAPGVFDYAHRVAHDVATVTVAAVPTGPGGAIAIQPADAHAAAPGHQVDLAAGATTTVTVVAENGGSNTYTVRIHRPLPAADASLRVLRLDHVDFGPFHGARADYAAAVPFGTAVTTVTARTASDGASAAIAPADADAVTAGHQVDLAAGAVTAIAVTVMATDGVATRTYTVRVGRAAAGAPGTVPTLPADLTRQNILGHIRTHGIDSVEGLVAALPRLHKLHAVLVYESEALFKDHVSAEHPRVVSWGANADFVLSWATDPDSPGYEGVEFLRPVEGDWVAGVIDFSGPSPRITEPEICGTCHGPLNKPLWGPNNFWDGTEGENESHRYTEPVTERAAEATLRAMRSSDPRLQPLHLIHQGPGSVEERAPRVVINNGENLHLLPEITNTLIFQHDRVMFDIVKARPDYPRIARKFMCASFPSKELPDLFELRDHHMARLADTLAHIQGNERIDVELYTGLYTNGGTPFTFLILHDLWRRDARVAAALAQYDGDIERFHRMMFAPGEAVLLERTVQNILAGGRLLQVIDGRVCDALGGKPPVLGGDDGDELTVTGFTVVDGAGAALRRLREGDVLALGAPGLGDLAIRADVAAHGVASVRLEIAAVESGTGAAQVSGVAPHTLDYGGAPAVDEYYVSATPYPEPALGGEPGATLTVRFLVRDFDSLAGGDPRGLWSDGDTLWVLGADASLLAYDLTDGTREADRDIVLDADNGDPRGLWSDGAIAWVLDGDGAVYAYDLANGGRAADRDIVLDTFNGDPLGLWSDGAIVWVLDGDGALYAYDLEYGRREIGRDIALDADNGDPRGLWSHGATLWVIDADDARHYAYDPATARRAPERDLTASAALGTDDPAGLWTDGDSVWAVDGDGVLRTAVLPQLFPLRSLHLSGVDMPRFDSGKLDYSAVAPNSTARTTVGATVSADAYATIAPADADPDTDGHQVDLLEGDNEIAVTVSNVNTTLTYTVSVRRQAVVESFTFVHVPTSTNVLTLREDGVVDLGAFWDRDELADAVNIHANLSSGVAVGSVRVELTGDATQRWTHNEPPYRIHRKLGQPLTAGTYRISATPFPEPRGQGAAGTTFAVDFTVEGDTGKPVRSFTLVHTDSDEEPIVLEDGAIIDIGALEARRFNVHANLAPGATVGSVRVQSSGRETRSRADNGAPYSLFAAGRSMPIGTYTVNARAYHFGNGSGDVSDKSEVTFTLAGITGRATGFTLVHAPTGDDIAALEDGHAFDLGAIAGRTNEFSIRADVEGDAGIGSVRLLLTGERTVQGVDNEAPYVSWPTDLVAGVYRITAIPYTEPELGGERLPALSADFTLAGVLGEPGTPLAGFTLVDAAGDPPNPDIQAIADGTLLDRAALPSNWFNIRADVKDGYDVGSVHLELTGPTARSATRNDAPHTVFGHRRSDGNYWGARLPDGDYVIEATPYPDPDGGGIAWPTMTAAFSFGTAVSALPEVSVAAGASPVPEGSGATFTLTRTGPATAPLSVDVAVTETGAMLAGNPTSLTFAANASDTTLIVGTNDDAVVEDASTVTATVAPGTGYTVAGGSAQVTVQDNDVAELALSAAPETIEEGGSATIAVEITNGVTFAERTYILTHWSGTATQGEDYALTGAPTALWLAPGAASGTVTVTALDDTDEEDAETVTVTASHGGAALGTVTVTIAASDMRSDDATLSGLALSGIDIGGFQSDTTAYAADVDNAVETTVVTATATHEAASVVIGDGDGGTTDAPRTVALAEDANTISVTVTAEDGVATQTYTVTVTRAAVALTAAFEGVPASHDGDSTSFTLGLRFSEPIGIGYRTLRDESLVATGGAVTGARRVNGQSDLWEIEVAPASDDDVTLALPATPDCTVANAVCTRDGKPLSQGIEATVAGPAQPEVSIAGAATVTEGTDAAFTLTRTEPVGDALTVAVEVTETGSMLGANPPASVTFGAGDDTATLLVATDDDAVAEGPSTVTATVAGGTGYTAAPGADSAQVTVQDNDAVFEFSVDPLEVVESGAAAITLTIANGVTFAQAQGIALDFSGSATKGGDYVVSAETLALAAGAGSVAATLIAVHDAEEEGAETVTVTASHGGTVVGTATVTIAASEASAAFDHGTAFPQLPEDSRTYYDDIQFYEWYARNYDFAKYVGYQDLLVKFDRHLPAGRALTVLQAEGDSHTPDSAGIVSHLFDDPGSSTHNETVAGFLTHRDGHPNLWTQYQTFSMYLDNFHASTTANLREFAKGLDSGPTYPAMSYDGLALTPAKLLNVSNSNGGGADIVRRFDKFVEENDLVACTAMSGGSDGNQSASGTAYNSIVVHHPRAHDSQFAGAAVNDHGAPRYKPDIVTRSGEASASSWSTPTVCSAAAMLLERALVDAEVANAYNSVALKAILMAGATRFDYRISTHWSDVQAVADDVDSRQTLFPLGEWERTSDSLPLSPKHGAGALNVLAAYEILDAGEFDPGGGGTVGVRGWDYAQGHEVGDTLEYTVSLDRESVFSAVLVWHRYIDDSFASHLPDYELSVHDDADVRVAYSDSTTSNVELIEAKLPAGDYRVSVAVKSNGGTADGLSYGLAWIGKDVLAAPVDVAVSAASETAWTVSWEEQSDRKYRVSVAADAGFSDIDREVFVDGGSYEHAVPADGTPRHFRVYAYPVDGKVAYQYPSEPVAVRSPQPHEPGLAALVLSDVDIGVFDSATASYSATVGHDVAETTVSATLTAAAADAAATVAIVPEDADADAAGHQVGLAEGSNTVTATVTAEDDSTRTYTVTVTRAAPPSHDATLSGLGLSGIDIGAFDSATTSYAASVAHDVAATTVTATTHDAAARLAVSPADGDANAPGHQVELAVGSNAVTATVTAEDNYTTRTYTVTVTRAAPALPQVSIAAAGAVTEGADATFTLTRTGAATGALTVDVDVAESGGMLTGVPPTSATFAASRSSATLTVATHDDAVVEDASTLTATIVQGTGFVVANGSAQATVADNDTATFDVSVDPDRIEEGSSATLTVAIANGVTFAQQQSLSLGFGGTAMNGIDYTVSPAPLALSAGASSTTATLAALDDTDEEDAETVTVTASHGGAALGTVTVTIAASDMRSDDATLSGLALSGIDIGGFQSDTTAYAADVAHAVETTVVAATARHESASLAIADVAGSTTDAPRTVQLAEGSNTITVTVTAEDSATTRTYTVTVTRQAALSDDATLSALSLTGIDIAFAADTTAYAADTAHDVETTEVTATATHEGASVAIADVNGSTPGGRARWPSPRERTRSR